MIDNLIKEGKEMLERNDFGNLNLWKRKVQFFVEQKGSLSMKEEIEKELKKKALWVSYVGAPEGFTDSAFQAHYKSQTENLVAILEAIKQTDLPVSKKEKGKKNKKEKNLLNRIFKNG